LNPPSEADVIMRSVSDNLPNDFSIFRAVRMRLGPLQMRIRTHRDAELPLRGLPVFKWRSFRVWRRRHEFGSRDRGQFEDLRRSGKQRKVNSS
jgi:hypothetical protein